MDRRFDPRFLTELEVRVTDLAKPARSGAGRMTDISVTGMGVAVPFELAEGDIVQLDVDDSFLYGIVVHARADGSRYVAGVEIQRVLIGGSDMSRILQRALQDMLPQVPGVMAGSLSA